MSSVAIVMNAKTDTTTSFRAMVVKAATAIQSAALTAHAREVPASAIVNLESLGKYQI